MKSILVPIDFSAASRNAVDYAARLSLQYGYEEIILLTVHYESFMDYISTLGVGYSFMGKDASFNYRKKSKDLLKHLQKTAQAQLPENTNIKVRTATSDLPLTRATLEILAENAGIELVVLGSDHMQASEPGFITANIISIVRVSPVKVLIVPEGHAYQPIRKILVPCDLKHMIHLSKLEQYKVLLETQQAQLTVLNILADQREEEADLIKDWEHKLHTYFDQVQLEVKHLYDSNTLHGVLSYVEQHDTDLIVALPGSHSFLYYMANKSLSEGIYKNTNQAILLLK